VNKLIKKLNEPFPDDTSFRDNIFFIVGVGIFVTLFLYLLQPFGIQTYPQDPFLICLGFGILTIVAGIAYDFFEIYVLRLVKDVPSWTLWKWMLNMACLILFISLCNYLYMTYLMGWQNFVWTHFLHMIYNTLAIGIFPIVLSGLLIQMNAYKRNQKQAENIQSALIPITKPTQFITLTSQNKSQSLKVATDHLFYLEAQQNYVSIYHLQEGKIEKTVFRNTIKQMEAQLQTTPLFRCHRSFLVNTELIEKVAGNAQGLRLSLSNLPEVEIPVSRKYIAALKSLIG